MAETKYKYNYRSLNYERIELTFRDKVLNVLKFSITGMVFAAIILVCVFIFVDSPKEKILKRENAQLKSQYRIMDKKLDQIESVLADMQNRDDNIYRVIFEAEPIPENIRKSGIGGVNRYEYLEGFKSSDLFITTSKKLDELSKQLYVQSRSFDEVIKLAKNKKKLLASIPAIQPVSNKDLTRIASGYGYRIDPIYKTTKFHQGMDFTAPRGTDIYATGNGVVEYNEHKMRGYGNYVVIDHGFGYKTLYGHMSKILVKPGQKVKRGEIIGLVGNTGKSVGPHCHYEVRKNAVPINPANFYFNDLTPEEYERMLEISSAATQSFD